MPLSTNTSGRLPSGRTQKSPSSRGPGGLPSVWAAALQVGGGRERMELEYPQTVLVGEGRRAELMPTWATLFSLLHTGASHNGRLRGLGGMGEGRAGWGSAKLGKHGAAARTITST